MRGRGFAARALLVALTVAAVGSARAEPADDDLQHALDRIRTAPRRADGFGDLAAWLFRRGDLSRARAAAAEAVRLEPDSAHYQRLLGYVAAAGGEESEAEAAFRRAADLDPHASVSLADFHLARAWAGYQEALRRNGPEPSVLERLREIAAATEIGPELKAMLRGGWPEEAPPPRDEVPPIELGDGVGTALVVEKRTQTVRLYGRGPNGVTLLKTYPCTTGQAEGAKQERGDLKTPDGVYFFTDLLPGERLPDQYGALAMPLNYPNAWDRRAGRSGHGIWFHGSDRLTSPFTPRDTQGCVLMRNDDLLELAGLVQPLSTPVLIAESVPDRPRAEWQAVVRRHQRPGEPAASVIAAPEYTLRVESDADAVTYDFAAGGEGARYVLEDALPLARAEAWEEKLRLLRPEVVASLRNVRVVAAERRIVLETSAPVAPLVFRPELTQRLYLDLRGVRSGPTPDVYDGGGLVERVRVSAAATEPPVTRVVVDLAGDAQAKVESEGNEIIVSIGAGEGPVLPRRSAHERGAPSLAMQTRSGSR